MTRFQYTPCLSTHYRAHAFPPTRSRRLHPGRSSPCTNSTDTTLRCVPSCHSFQLPSAVTSSISFSFWRPFFDQKFLPLQIRILAPRLVELVFPPCSSSNHWTLPELQMHRCVLHLSSLLVHSDALRFAARRHFSFHRRPSVPFQYPSAARVWLPGFQDCHFNDFVEYDVLHLRDQLVVCRSWCYFGTCSAASCLTTSVFSWYLILWRARSRDFDDGLS